MYIDNIFKATATLDNGSNKVYATVKWYADQWFPFGLGPGDIIFAIFYGKYTMIGLLENTEIHGNEFILVMGLLQGMWPNISEVPVLLKKLQMDIPLVRPYADISLAIPGNIINSQLQALKDRIAGTLNFAQAAELIGLTSSSQATVKINAGNPATIFETMIANKVKAKFSTEGIELFPQKTKCQVITSGSQPFQQFTLLDYVCEMREALRLGIFNNEFHLSVLDENLNEVVSSKKITGVHILKRDGIKKYILELEGIAGDQIEFLARTTYTAIIEKLTVKKLDYDLWFGGSDMALPLYPFLNKENGQYKVDYIKKCSDSDGDVYLELHDFGILWGLQFHNKNILLTVDQEHFFGTIRSDKYNKVTFVAPTISVRFLWTKKMASLKSHGTAYFNLIEVGSSAKPEALTLKVEFDTLTQALSVLRELQSPATAGFTVAQVNTVLGELEVTDAEVSPAERSVRVMNSAVTFATGTVKWFNKANFFEIRLEDNSTDKMTVCDGAGIFRDLLTIDFLDAVILDIKKMKEKADINLVDLPFSNNNLPQVWIATVTHRDLILGEGYRMFITDAEIKQTVHGSIYKFSYQSSMPMPYLFIWSEQNVDSLFRFHFTRKMFMNST
jgi:hypothetical protein